MTSLIDVIFLLLLFFMLSSTVSRFAEVEIAMGGGLGAAQSPDDTRLLFLRVTETGLTLNGQPVSQDSFAAEITKNTGATTVLVSVTQTSTAQILTDVLVALRALPDVNVSVLEAS